MGFLINWLRLYNTFESTFSSIIGMSKEEKGLGKLPTHVTTNIPRDVFNVMSHYIGVLNLNLKLQVNKRVHLNILVYEYFLIKGDEGL